jgi:hypothetical protein
VDGRPTSSVTVDGYHGQDDMGGLQRDAFTPYHNQFPRSGMSRALGQADTDFPPYDLLYGLVDLFFKVSDPSMAALETYTDLVVCTCSTYILGVLSYTDKPH